MLEAAAFLDHELPEVFAGLPRDETPFPIAYPTAARPQAWAAGTPVLLLQLLLGLRPEGGKLVTDGPPVPEWAGSLRLSRDPRLRPRVERLPRGRPGTRRARMKGSPPDRRHQPGLVPGPADRLRRDRVDRLAARRRAGRRRARRHALRERRLAHEGEARRRSSSTPRARGSGTRCPSSTTASPATSAPTSST